MTATSPLQQPVLIEQPPVMIHLRHEGERTALCGYAFPIAAQEHNHPLAENDCHICQEIYDRMKRPRRRRFWR